MNALVALLAWCVFMAVTLPVLIAGIRDARRRPRLYIVRDDETQ